MGVINSMAKKAARSRHNEFLEYVRAGWSNYSFVFYIGGVSAILGSLFGIAGWLSVIVTVAFFYYAGKFVDELQLEKKRLKRQRKER